MKKRGFTLIELLAVIVILAIIALIATPIILNMISNARKSAAKSSALGYIDAINYNNELADAKGDIDGLSDYEVIESGNVSTINGKVKMKGEKATSGVINYNSDGSVKKASICINNHQVNYSSSGTVSTKENCISNSLSLKEFIDAFNSETISLPQGLPSDITCAKYDNIWTYPCTKIMSEFEEKYESAIPTEAILHLDSNGKITANSQFIYGGEDMLYDGTTITSANNYNQKLSELSLTYLSDKFFEGQAYTSTSFMFISNEEAENANGATLKIYREDGKKMTVNVTKVYSSMSVITNKKIYPKDGYKILAYTMNNVPSNTVLPYCEFTIN